MSKKIAVLGANKSSMPFYRQARNLGYEIIGIAYAEGAVCKEYCDRFYPVSFADKDKVLDICRENNIKSIRIDCNKSFNNRISSILMELGFVSLPVDYPERINFLREKYPNYQIPEQLDLLFQRYS